MAQHDSTEIVSGIIKELQQLDRQLGPSLDQNHSFQRPINRLEYFLKIIMRLMESNLPLDDNATLAGLAFSKECLEEITAPERIEALSKKDLSILLATSLSMDKILIEALTKLYSDPRDFELSSAIEKWFEQFRHNS